MHRFNGCALLLTAAYRADPKCTKESQIQLEMWKGARISKVMIH